jgi:hypothetical protein
MLTRQALSWNPHGSTEEDQILYIFTFYTPVEGDSKNTWRKGLGKQKSNVSHNWRLLAHDKTACNCSWLMLPWVKAKC